MKDGTWWRCSDCNNVYKDKHILRSINPFHKAYNIFGCPNCFAIDKERKVCDEPNCQQVATCGSPVKDGYRQTCSEHLPSQP